MYLADEQRHVADVEAGSARGLVMPPQFSNRSHDEPDLAAVTAITDGNDVTVSSSAPLRLDRGVSTTLKLTGRYFSTAVTFTYPTGITDNTPAVVTATLITLSLLAALSMDSGLYSLTVNDGTTTNGHLYRNILAVY